MPILNKMIIKRQKAWAKIIMVENNIHKNK